MQRHVCSVFNINPDDVRVISLFVGGAFGIGLRPQYEVTLAVLAARALERSVRLVLTRQQMYSLSYRPGSIERIAVGAKASGRAAFTVAASPAHRGRWRRGCPGHRLRSCRPP